MLRDDLSLTLQREVLECVLYACGRVHELACPPSP